VPDKLRKLDWPPPFTARVMNNRIIRDWHGRENELTESATVEREGARYFAAMQSGDADNTGVWVGEAAGMIRDVPHAGDVVQRIAQEAEKLLSIKAPGFMKVDVPAER
jgi:nitronate monooxygenase